MKKIILFFISALTFSLNAQQHICSIQKQLSAAKQLNNEVKKAALTPQISHELKYDVKFVHLNLNLERINKYVSGGVKTVGLVLALPLDTFQTLLHQNYTIDSIRFNGVLLTSIRKDSLIKVSIAIPLPSGSTFTSIVYYKGTAPTGGAAIGSGYSNALPAHGVIR